MKRLLLWFPALVVVACGSDSIVPASDAGADADLDGALDGAADAGPACVGPPGLYQNAACDVLAAGIVRYTPQFQLWSDGTDKERFISIPDGEQIDTSAANGWEFPVGTRIWKTFALDGTRLETRFLEKTGFRRGFGSWVPRTFQWLPNQTEVVEVFTGALDVLGSDHDIPAVSDCRDCHDGGGQPDGVLGFGAIQLNHLNTSTNLVGLDASGQLTQAVPPGLAVVPGDSIAAAALGYMHANCGHCHGQDDPEADLGLHLMTGLASAEASPAYLTAVGVQSRWAEMGSDIRVDPGSPSTSTLFQRIGIRDGIDEDQMPPLATEQTDPAGLTIIETWIMSLGR